MTPTSATVVRLEPGPTQKRQGGFAGVNRRGFLRGAMAACGAAFAWTAFGPTAPAQAANPCILYPPPREIKKGSTCRVRFGEPDANRSCIDVYSPNYAYVLDDCCVTCLSGCGTTYAQARGACCNGGACSCTGRYF